MNLKKTTTEYSVRTLLIITSLASFMATFPSLGNDLASTARLRPSILRDLGRNTVSLTKEVQTYILWGAMLTIPEIAEHESNSIYRGWTRSLKTDHVFELGNMTGNAAAHIGGSVLLYGIGKLSHSDRVATVGSEIFSTQLIAGGVSLTTKYITNRTRPDGARFSFPSGHTTVAFSTAGVVFNNFGAGYGIAAEIVACYVGLSRLQENKHYITDVVAGAILGNYVAYKVCHSRNSRDRFLIQPNLSATGFGVNLAIAL